MSRGSGTACSEWWDTTCKSLNSLLRVYGAGITFYKVPVRTLDTLCFSFLIRTVEGKVEANLENKHLKLVFLASVNKIINMYSFCIITANSFHRIIVGMIASVWGPVVSVCPAISVYCFGNCTDVIVYDQSLDSLINSSLHRCCSLSTITYQYSISCQQKYQI